MKFVLVKSIQTYNFENENNNVTTNVEKISNYMWNYSKIFSLKKINVWDKKQIIEIDLRARKLQQQKVTTGEMKKCIKFFSINICTHSISKTVIACAILTVPKYRTC